MCSKYLFRSCCVSLAFLAACATEPPDAHVPPFARKPYETISRDAIVAIATREWRLFGSPSDDPQSAGQAAEKPERQQGLWQRVGEYWWLGLDAGATESQWTGKHDENGAVFPPERDGDYPWSAAFVSYVMRIAGAGARFPYSSDHEHYIDVAKRQAMNETSGWMVTAERAEVYAPRRGDLVCKGRDWASGLRYDDLPVGGYFPAHCAFVVDISPQQIALIGGNERDAVTLSHLSTTSEGKIVPSDPTEHFLAILKLEGVPDSQPDANAPIAFNAR
jgi:hypothetical protein